MLLASTMFNNFYGYLSLIPVVLYAIVIVYIQVRESVFRKYILHKNWVLIGTGIFFMTIAIIMIILALTL